MNFQFSNSVVFLEKVIRIGINLVLVSYIVRYLGPSNFGKLTLFQRYFDLLPAIVVFGLTGISQNRFATIKEQLVINEMLSIRILLVSSVLFLFVVVYNIYMLDPIYWLYILAVSSLGLNVFFDLLKHQDKWILISTTKILLLICSSAFKILVVYYDLGINVLLCTVFVFKFIEGVIWTFPNFRYLREFKFTLKLSVLKSTFPLFIGGYLTVLITRIDYMLLQNIASPDVIGYYGAAQRIIAILVMFVTTQLVIGESAFYRNKSNTWSFSMRTIVAYVSLLILIAVFAGPVIVLYLGEDFSKSVDIFRILLVKVLFYPYVFLRNSIYVRAGRHAHILISNFIILIIFSLILLIDYDVYILAAFMSVLFVPLVFYDLYVDNRSQIFRKWVRFSL